MTSARPLLLGEPIPLPARFQGAYAGATVSFNLDRVLELTYTQAELLAPIRAAQTALQAEREALAAGEPTPDTLARAAALVAEQGAINQRLRATLAAYCVYALDAGPLVTPAPDDVPGWEAASPVITGWIVEEGLAAARAQIGAPFFSSASASSSSTGA